MNKMMFQQFGEPMLSQKSLQITCHLNELCGEVLGESINNHYKDYSLDTEGVLSDVLKEYSPERIAYVLAVRVYDNNGFDKRFSKENEAWAKNLLSEIHPVFKDKNNSPIRRNLNFLPSHNGLADILITDFRKRFPDLTLQPDDRIITSNLKPKWDGALANLDKPAFDVDFDEFKEMGYLCIEMEYPDAETAWLLMMMNDGDPEYVSNVLLDKTDFKDCYVDVYEDGRLLLIVSCESVDISIEAEDTLRKILNSYTKERFGLNLASTVHKAIHGEKPPVIGKDVINKE